MKFLNTLALVLTTLLLVSCNFTETMTMNEDGSGKISVMFDGSEMMAMAGDAFKSDSLKGEGEKQKMDSIIDFKEFIEENRDSIMQLPAKEQAEIMAMERFKMHIIMDESEGKMLFDMFTEFEDISEASNILDGFDNLDGFMGQDQNNPASPQPKTEESVKVKYAFEGNTFTRDAYLIDPEKYQVQVDSLKSMEMFFGGSSYKLQYSFPRKIKSSNRPSATYSADGKTLYYQVSFMDYMKDPNIMDIEVVLED